MIGWQKTRITWEKLLSVRFIQTAATGAGRTPERRQRQWSAMQVMKVGKIISCS